MIKAGIGLLTLIAGASVAQAVTTWTGSAGNQDWFDSGNWDSGTPGDGADAVIGSSGGAVLLTNSTANLGSLTLSANTLTCSNWVTKLSATTITLNSDAIITLPAAFTNGIMSNRVWIACSNLLVNANAAISVNGSGYRGGPGANADGFGPGRGWDARAGGGYGGFGGGFPNTAYPHCGGTTYGEAAAPIEPGSGGAGGNIGGGAGGGVVRIEADGAVTVNGSISANGAYPGYYAGGGSGGAIYITCRMFAGTAGVIEARGGNVDIVNCGPGGGGRIALHYDTAAQELLAKPTVTFSAQPGKSVSGTVQRPGGLGTLSFSDASLLSEKLTSGIEGYISGFPSWSVDHLTIDNAWVGFSEEGFQLVVTNDVLIAGTASQFQLGGTVYENVSRKFFNDNTNGPAIYIGGNLIISNKAAFAVCAGLSGVPAYDGYGARVSVTGDVSVVSNAVLYLSSHPTNGGSVLLEMTNLFVEAGSSISAAARGYSGGSYAFFSPSSAGCSAGFGPGRGPSIGFDHGGGAGYGGEGGDAGRGSLELGGTNYGSVSAPIDPGSGAGGGAYWGAGGNGGGLIRIAARGNVTVDGTLDASGGVGYNNYGGAGSGGGIFITCQTLAGSNGVIKADGGSTGFAAGGGGGGRIAVVYDQTAQSNAPVPQIRFSANRGTGGDPNWLSTNDRDHYFGNSDGQIGTLYFPDNTLLGETIINTGIWSVPGFTAWSPASLTVDNSTIRFPVDGFALNVAGDVVISGSAGALELSNAVMTCGNNLTITDGSLVMYGSTTSQPLITVGSDLNMSGSSSGSPGTMVVYAGETNASIDYGALITVTGAMNLASNAWVYPVTHPTQGGSPLFRVSNLVIGAASAGFNANAKGFERVGDGTTYNDGLGPGHGYTKPSKVRPSGAGYGGRGGRSTEQTTVGAIYGITNAPRWPGSSGGSGGAVLGRIAARGGGLIRIEATQTVDLGGTLTANSGLAGAYGGGGSGGGIFVTCNSFTGAVTAVMQTKGGASGDGTCGGGGGGRIAVWHGVMSETDRDYLLAGDDGSITASLIVTNTIDSYLGTISVTNGAGYNSGDPAQYSQPGTAVFVSINYPPPGTVISFR